MALYIDEKTTIYFGDVGCIILSEEEMQKNIEDGKRFRKNLLQIAKGFGHIARKASPVFIGIGLASLFKQKGLITAAFAATGDRLKGSPALKRGTEQFLVEKMQTFADSTTVKAGPVLDKTKFLNLMLNKIRFKRLWSDLYRKRSSEAFKGFGQQINHAQDTSASSKFAYWAKKVMSKRIQRPSKALKLLNKLYIPMLLVLGEKNNVGNEKKLIKFFKKIAKKGIGLANSLILYRVKLSSQVWQIVIKCYEELIFSFYCSIILVASFWSYYLGVSPLIISFLKSNLFLQINIQPLEVLLHMYFFMFWIIMGLLIQKKLWNLLTKHTKIGTQRNETFNLSDFKYIFFMVLILSTILQKWFNLPE